MHSTLVLSVLAVLSKSVRAIQVVGGSPCYDTCGGGNTYSTDLVCNDGDYTATTYGQKMASCLSCESTSLAVNNSNTLGGDTDEYWFMFNMKYTLEYCVTQSTSPITGVQACQDACQPLDPVLDTSWLSSTEAYAKQYDYCSIQSGAFPADAANCSACLQSQEGSVVLGNFAVIMSDACSSQPMAENGNLVLLPRALLDTTTIASTAGTTSSQSSGASTAISGPSSSSSPATSTTSGATNISSATSYSSSSASSTAAGTSTTSSSGLSSGAAAAVGIGIGLVAAGLTAALVVWILRRRKQHRQNLNGAYAPEMPAYRASIPLKSAQEKDGFASPAVSELGHSPAVQELPGRQRYEADGGPEGRQCAFELDTGRNYH